MSKACTASRISGNCGMRSSGASRAVRLVVRIEIGAERLFGFVEDHREMRRLVLRLHVAQQLPQHVAETEHGIDLQAVRFAAKRRQRVIGAEDVARSVDQKDVIAFLQSAGGSGCGGLRGSGLVGGGFFRGFGCWHGGNVGRPARNGNARRWISAIHSVVVSYSQSECASAKEPPPEALRSGLDLLALSDIHAHCDDRFRLCRPRFGGLLCRFRASGDLRRQGRAARSMRCARARCRSTSPACRIWWRSNVRQGRLSFSTDLNGPVADAEAVFIAVGTPSRRGDGHADLTYVYDAARESGAGARRFHRGGDEIDRAGRHRR